MKAALGEIIHHDEDQVDLGPTKGRDVEEIEAIGRSMEVRPLKQQPRGDSTPAGVQSKLAPRRPMRQPIGKSVHGGRTGCNGWLPPGTRCPSMRKPRGCTAEQFAAARTTGRSARPRLADLLIASTAAANGLPLYTRNPSDFAALQKLVTLKAV